eukprot:m.107126 g.107126  ORF g.107126 m.107126 type:complete len:109 (+) comp13319_c1_seq4:588-914(+)
MLHAHGIITVLLLSEGSTTPSHVITQPHDAVMKSASYIGKTVTASLRCTGISQCHRHNVTMSRCHNVTMSQCEGQRFVGLLTAPVLHAFALPLPLICTVPPLRETSGG